MKSTSAGNRMPQSHTVNVVRKPDSEVLGNIIYRLMKAAENGKEIRKAAEAKGSATE